MKTVFPWLPVALWCALGVAGFPIDDGFAEPPDRLVVCDDVQGPLTLDPCKNFSACADTLIQHLFDGLLRIDERGEIAPGLAERWERLDSLRMRFTMRNGVRFHNGDPVRPDDVVFSISRYLAPATGFPAREYFSSITDVLITSPCDVVVVTSSPDGLLERKLALLKIIPKDYVTAKGDVTFGTNPIGTGPFVFETWVKEHSIVMHANAEYWEAGVPRIKQLVFRFIDSKEQVAALLRGEVDLLTDIPGTETMKVARESRLSLQKRYCFLTFTASLNNTQVPFSSLDGRKAVNLCLDRKDLIKYEARGNGRIIATCTMPGEFGHNAQLIPCEHDLDEARRLFSRAFAGHPHKVHALVKAQATRVAEVLRACLVRVGVDMDITITTDAEMATRKVQHAWDLFLGSCPDPFCHSGFVQSIVVSSYSPFSLAKHPEYDKRYARAVTTIDAQLQEQELLSLDTYIFENCLALFTYQKQKILAHRKGLVISPHVSGMACFHDAVWRSDGD